jgi:hypothetical protein
MYLCLYGAGRNDFDAGNIHCKGDWKGWALKIEHPATVSCLFHLNPSLFSCSVDLLSFPKKMVFLFQHWVVQLFQWFLHSKYEQQLIDCRVV